MFKGVEKKKALETIGKVFMLKQVGLDCIGMVSLYDLRAPRTKLRFSRLTLT